MRKLLAIILSLLAAPAAGATLTVMAPSSFVGKYGPGPAIKQAFEAECACTLAWVALDDGVAMLNRLRLEGARSGTDVVLGLDASMLVEAEATGLFAPHGQDNRRLALPIAWASAVPGTRRW